MAGNFIKLFSQDFTAVTTVTVVHGLDRVQVAIVARIGNVARNDLVESVGPDPSDPRNAVIVTFATAQTGNIILMDTDHVYSNSPSPETSAVLSGGTAMTANVYDPTDIAASPFARANHTGTQLASTVSDFDAEVGNNAAVTANSAKVTNATHSGDVTGATALTIAPAVVANSMLANMLTARIKGRFTAGTGDPEDLTGRHVTALLSPFTDAFQGVAPASGGGTANFLRADGTWAAPSGGGTFGQDYQTAISVARETTTSTVFQDKVTLTTPTLTGTYRVGWHAVVDQNNAQDKCWVQLYNTTDAAVVGALQVQEPKDPANRIAVGGFAEVVFSGAAKSFIIQYRQQGGNTAGIQDARIEIWRVS